MHSGIHVGKRRAEHQQHHDQEWKPRPEGHLGFETEFLTVCNLPVIMEVQRNDTCSLDVKSYCSLLSWTKLPRTENPQFCSSYCFLGICFFFVVVVVKMRTATVVMGFSLF